MSLLSRSRRLPPPTPPVLELDDIQGNTVLGYYLPSTSYVFLTVADPIGARQWLAELAPQLRMSDGPRKDGVALNLAITARGLQALGVPTRLLARLPTAFRVGMAARARLFGDPVDARSHPIGWDAPFGGDPLHLMLMVSGEQSEVAARIAQLRSDCWQDGICELADPLDTHRLPGDLEHFGYRDGLSGPLIRELSAGVESSRPRIPAGEFILGMPAADERRDLTEPWLTRNGSYLALRKLEQDVAGFRAMLRRVARARGLSEDEVAARIMGRHPDGRPITTSPTTAGLTELSDQPVQERPSRGSRILSNDFDYSGDDGSGCPVGSHVRRANPRGSLKFDGKLENRHQLIRRGLPYGEEYSGRPDDTAPRGLVFACYQADLAAQFEFVQSQWLNDGNAFGLGAECDPIAGMTPSGPLTAEPFSFGGLPGSPALPSEQIARYISTRGGEYFLVPGRRSLLNLSRLAPDEDGIRLWARCSS